MKEEEKQRILSALSSNVEEIRYRAVQRLPEIYSDLPVDKTIQALGDESWRIRKSVSAMLSEVGTGSEMISALVRALGEEENAGLRNSASEVLKNIGTPALPDLLKVLTGGDKDERKLAADILGDIGDQLAVGPLAERLHDQDENVRAASAEALGMIGDKNVADQLVGLLDSDGLLVQLSCLDALDRLNTVVPGDVLRSLLSVGPLRPHLYRLLGKLRGENVLPTLLEGLQARGRVERAAAARSIMFQYLLTDKQTRVEIQVSVARAASDQITSSLRSLLASTSTEDREAAVMILGWSGRLDVVEELIGAARDVALRDLVHEAILQIGPKSAQILQEIHDKLGRAEKVLAVDLLGHFAQPSSMALIIELSLSEDLEVAETAQRALARMGNPSVISTLAAFLRRNHDSPPKGVVSSLVVLGSRFHDEVFKAISPLLDEEMTGLRRAAAEILCGSARKTDMDVVLRLVGDEDSQVRNVAVASLGRVGDAVATDKLRVALTDESAQVRISAARALGMRDDPDAHRILQVALKDPDAWVVKEVLLALGKSGDPGIAESILPLCGHENGLVALEAVRAINHLAWTGDPAWLEATCRHKDPEVIKEVIAGSGRWPVTHVRKVLVQSLKDPHWDVRAAAVKRIGEMRDSEAKQAVFERLGEEKDELVREEIERVLDMDGQGE